MITSICLFCNLLSPIISSAPGACLNMSRRAHNWDTQRAISNRRGSDADYDPREPRRSHVDARPEPSYYGPNFQNVQRGLSSSIAYGDIQHPPVPDPYVKRPNPWPREVVDDYLHYKRTETSYRRAKKEYGRDNLAGSSKKDPQYDIKMSEAYDLAADARSSANGYVYFSLLSNCSRAQKPASH